MTDRSLVFVSHANPEDNAAARWFSAKLRLLGYDVFLDLDRFKGGTEFWGTIERAIRQDAAKVVFLLSTNSNHKEGTLKELTVASNTARALACIHRCECICGGHSQGI